MTRTEKEKKPEYYKKKFSHIRVLEKNKIPRFDRIFASYSRKES